MIKLNVILVLEKKGNYFLIKEEDNYGRRVHQMFNLFGGL
jgi:hypothetical protein